MPKLVFSSHVALIKGKEYDGIGNSLKATLRSMGIDYIFVRNSMDGLLASEVQYFVNGDEARTVDLLVKRSPAPLRYISEYRRTVKYFSTQNESEVFIGIDPLNALAAIRLKKKGKVAKAVFYTADYSSKRFANPVLNMIYHAIDRYCVRNADEVWSVSTRICEVRRRMGLAERKNIFLPNVPPAEYDYLKQNTHDKYELITTGIIDKQLDFEGTIRAVAILKDEFPQLHFTIVGNGPEEDRLRELATVLGVAEKVEFTGRLSLAETLTRVSKAGIGLALYTGTWGFNYYGDSTKCREYFNFALPVVSTDTHSTVTEINDTQAGVVIPVRDVDAICDGIREVIADYEQYSNHSRELGTKYSGSHKRRIEAIIE